MSWSTELFCNITFSRESFNSKDEVYNRIDELQKCIQTAKDNIRDLVVITEPNKFCQEDDEPLSWLINEYSGYIELIEEYSVELYKLNMLLEHWDYCHNEDGLAIDPPDNITWKTSFLCGDFVNSVKRPHANE